jgi:hypothetical protein
MKLTLALAAFLAAGGLATAAVAAGPVTAKLQAPVEQATRVVAGGSIFTCEGDACAASKAGANALTPRGCRELVRAVGPISAYGTENKQFSDDRIAECNAWAKAGKAADAENAAK